MLGKKRKHRIVRNINGEKNTQQRNSHNITSSKYMRKKVIAVADYY